PEATRHTRHGRDSGLSGRLLADLVGSRSRPAGIQQSALRGFLDSASTPLSLYDIAVSVLPGGLERACADAMDSIATILAALVHPRLGIGCRTIIDCRGCRLLLCHRPGRRVPRAPGRSVDRDGQHLLQLL